MNNHLTCDRLSCSGGYQAGHRINPKVGSGACLPASD